MSDVLINFVGNTEELQPAVNVYDEIIKKDKELSDQSQKSSAVIQQKNKDIIALEKQLADALGGNADVIAALRKEIDDLKKSQLSAGEAWKKTATDMSKSGKEQVDQSNKLAKSIQAVADATKSMDKVVIGGAYRNYLKELQAQLGLTQKEVIKFVQTSREAAQQGIFAASDQEEINQLQVSIEVMNDVLTEFGTKLDDTTDKSKSLTVQIREAKNELFNMAAAGKEGTPEFIALQDHAAGLDNQLRVLNKTVKGLGSDTKNIEGLIGLAGGVAGGFAIAQGAAALFGNESEEVQQALLKVNAAMAILQGLQQIQNLMQKESAASLLFANTQRKVAVATTVAQTGATEGATVAQIGLNAAMDANPIGLIILGITALVAAISYFTSEEEHNTEAISRNIDAMNKQIEIIDRLKDLAKIDYSDADNILVNNLAIELQYLEAQGASQDKILAKKKELARATQMQNQDNYEALIKEEEQRLSNFYVQKNGEMQNALIAKGNGVAIFALLNLQRDVYQKINDLKRDGRELSDNEKKDLEVLNERAGNYDTRINRLNAAQKEFAKGNLDARKLELETAKYNAEQRSKDGVAFAAKELALAKINILQKEVDSVASLERVAKKEIDLVNAQKKADLRNNNLTFNERLNIETQAALKIAEINQQQEVKRLQIRKDAITAALAATRKGSQEEFDANMKLLAQEQAIELEGVEITSNKKKEIDARYQKERQELERLFQEQLLQNQISAVNAQLDAFGLTEDKKLDLTLQRLQLQRALEISQAQGNADKILQINADADKKDLEAKKAYYAAILELQLSTFKTFTAISDAAYNKTISSDKTSYEQKINAINNLLEHQLKAFNAEEESLKAQKAAGIVTQEEYNLKLQDIINRRTQAEIDAEAKITAATLAEIDKRLNGVKAVVSIFQKGLSATLGQTGLSAFLAGLTDMGIKVTEIFEKIKLGAKVTGEDLKKLAEAAIQSAQAIVNQIYADASAARQQIAADEIAALEEQKQRELNVKNLTEQQKKDIDDRYRREEKRIKIEAFNADKDAKKSQALINAALGATLAFAEYPWPYSLVVAGIIAGLAGIEIAEINRQQPPRFKGGVVDFKGKGTTTSDDNPIMISNRESIIKASSTAKWKGALQAINDDQFESYMQKHLMQFVFPEVPDYIQPTANGNIVIDYDLMARAFALQLAGIIPESIQLTNTIDEEGHHTYIQKGNMRQEILNKRYSMSSS